MIVMSSSILSAMQKGDEKQLSFYLLVFLSSLHDLFQEIFFNCHQRMGVQIHFRYTIALGLATLALVLLIAGAPSPWYQFDINGETVNWFVDHVGYSMRGVSFTCTYTDSCGDSLHELKAMFGLILACAICSIILLFVVWVTLIIFAFHVFHHVRKIILSTIINYIS